MCASGGGIMEEVEATPLFPSPGIEARPMLWTIALVLIVLWALGLVTATTMGGFIHVLLVIAIIAVLISVIQGRRIT